MKVNLRIPTSLNDVTLAQYQEFAKLESKLDETNDASIQLKIVEIFCNVPEIVVRNMKATDIAEICEIINTMFDSQHQLINRFTHNGIDYGFIPELDDMSFGEYMDLDSFIGDNDNLHRAINVLFRPIEHRRGNRYKIKEYNPDTSDIAKEFPLDVVLGAIVFFYNLGKELSLVMMNSLGKKNEIALAQHLLSQPNGDGLTHSMESLTEILQNLKISLN
jgi:hypothetical protein|tara:strand:- start:356 stop:1012 length:657 start_codon:yes stop_codon:yes gene_type:complete